MKSLKMGKGTVNYEQCGAVFAKQYKGEFTNEELIAKAATGLWYTQISGNPHSVTGEGTTQLAAIKDAITRTNEKIYLMEQAVKALQAAESEWPTD